MFHIFLCLQLVSWEFQQFPDFLKKCLELIWVSTLIFLLPTVADSYLSGTPNEFMQLSPNVNLFKPWAVKKPVTKSRFECQMASLVVEPTHLKNMIVKLDHFPK